MDEFEKWAVSRGYSLMDKRPDGSPHPRYPAIQTEAAWQAWQAAVKVGREAGMREAAWIAYRAESERANSPRTARRIQYAIIAAIAPEAP